MNDTAIEMGTLIETVKEEGTQTVKQLEDLCELIYECSVVLGQLEDICKSGAAEYYNRYRTDVTGRNIIL